VASNLLLLGPYVIAAVLATGAIIVRNRDLGSTTLFWIMVGSAGVLSLGWTGLLVALSRSDL
jgi:hypothetical protein